MFSFNTPPRPPLLPNVTFVNIDCDQKTTYIDRLNRRRNKSFRLRTLSQMKHVRVVFLILFCHTMTVRQNSSMIK